MQNPILNQGWKLIPRVAPASFPEYDEGAPGPCVKPDFQSKTTQFLKIAGLSGCSMAEILTTAKEPALPSSGA